MSKLPNSIEHGAPELEPHDVTLLPADTVRYWDFYQVGDELT